MKIFIRIASQIVKIVKYSMAKTEINALIVIVKDTVFHIVDSSINNIICIAIAPIPLINMFKEKISFVMSGVFSTLLTLTVIYKLKNNDETYELLKS